MAWVSLVIWLLIALPQNVLSSGSTLHLKDIVLGRCWSYKQFKQRHVNCTALWKAFHDSFAFKDPCKLNFSDYESFFAAAVRDTAVNKTLFWSGTKKAVHSYSDFDLRFTTLEDTLEGSMMNDLTWCGNPSLPNSSDGIDYNSCPNCHFFISFWGLASKKFAERARGVIRVMVNGSRFSDKGCDPIPAYQRGSFFGKYELPSLNVSAVTRLEVLVVHTINKKKLEMCGTGSIKLLQQDAESRGLTVFCYDNPDDVKHILCADHAKSEQCLFESEKPTDDSIWRITTIIFAVTSGVLLLLLLLVAVAMVMSPYRPHSFRKKGEDTVVLA